MLDPIDMAILKCLQENARAQWREIGERVHLTGQAVGGRIRKMEELGIIEGYTVRLNPGKLEPSIHALVTIFMKTSDHAPFQAFIQKQAEIIEAHRISGEGCYLLKVSVSDQEKLNTLLDDILHFGNYRVNLSIKQLK
ncbi:Lrp/AsnC family transcriptional regulator [Brevibacillus migulae]|uniref:Lrp/AsnC family transcriptional regulator n=1 Tax=Brevibacillus migulae TaxID=1644114 RepID=UPI00106DD352|nr:Lrp/AsnC family transcriptional regulator [Brevibacillus migulae]